MTVLLQLRVRRRRATTCPEDALHPGPKAGAKFVPSWERTYSSMSEPFSRMSLMFLFRL